MRIAAIQRVASRRHSTLSVGERHPRLVEIPSLPYLGSMVSQHSGAPEYDPSKTLEMFPELTKRFGEFYSIGLPGVGVGTHGTIVVLQDPHEMTKVLRSEGSTPPPLSPSSGP